ncbi:hypothetical protein D3C86_449260 [compost metagenome]
MEGWTFKCWKVKMLKRFNVQGAEPSNITTFKHYNPQRIFEGPSIQKLPVEKSSLLRYEACLLQAGNLTTMGG